MGKNLKLLKLKLLLLSLKRNLVRKLKRLLVPLLLRRSRLLPPRKTRNWEEEKKNKKVAKKFAAGKAGNKKAKKASKKVGKKNLRTEPEASKPIVKKSKKTVGKKTKKPKCQKFQIFYSLLFSFVLKLLLIQNPSRTLKTSMLTKQFLLNQISPPK